MLAHSHCFIHQTSVRVYAAALVNCSSFARTLRGCSIAYSFSVRFSFRICLHRSNFRISSVLGISLNQRVLISSRCWLPRFSLGGMFPWRLMQAERSQVSNPDLYEYRVLRFMDFASGVHSVQYLQQQIGSSIIYEGLHQAVLVFNISSSRSHAQLS